MSIYKLTLLRYKYIKIFYLCKTRKQQISYIVQLIKVTKGPN